MFKDRIRSPELEGKVMTAQEAVAFFKDGMNVGMSGFTRAGDCKVMPRALAERAQTESPSTT